MSFESEMSEYWGFSILSPTQMDHQVGLTRYLGMLWSHVIPLEPDTPVEIYADLIPDSNAVDSNCLDPDLDLTIYLPIEKK